MDEPIVNEIRNLSGNLIMTVNGPLDGADFSKQNLTRADFRGKNLRLAVFHKAQLHGADFTGATLSSTDFTFAVMTEAKLPRVKADWASFMHAKLQGADFTEACLAQTKFKHANLRGALFRDSDLQGAEINKDIRKWVHLHKVPRCPKGHPYTEDNTYVYVTKEGLTQKSCKECRRIRIEEHRKNYAPEKRERTVCRKGHPYTEENTYVYTNIDGKKQKSCRECTRIRKAEYHARKMEIYDAVMNREANGTGNEVPMCPKGHLYTDENTYIYITKEGFRRKYCRECRSLKQAEYRRM